MILSGLLNILGEYMATVFCRPRVSKQSSDCFTAANKSI